MSKKKRIRIEVEGADLLSIDQIEDFQGDLKSMDEKNLVNFAKQIEKLGFSEPISIWKTKKGQNFILDGHQRVAAIRYMVNEMGYEMPSALPVSYIHAKNRSQAKDMLLGNISQYGQINDDGLSEFLQGTDITMDELTSDYAFSGFNLPKFIEGFSPEMPDSVNKTLEFPEDADAKKSQVKTIQLFYDTTTATELTQMIEALKNRFKIESATKAMLFCVDRVLEAK